MAALPILQYPRHSRRLRRRSQPVSEPGGVRQLIADLKETLHAHANGIGLAAPQIGVHLRVVVVRLGSGPDRVAGPPLALVNPRILEASREEPDFDGCLSIPGLYGETVRPHLLLVEGLDEEGRHFERRFEGFDAVLVHHEIDHLNGILFIDRVEDREKLHVTAQGQRGG